MEAYRFARKPFAGSLSGKGAASKGARWNSIGVEMVYTAPTRALAMSEVAVHFTWATLPPDYMIMTIHIPDDISLTRLRMADLPADWMAFPHPGSTQKMGDDFIAGNKYCILQAPSAVVHGDFNYLINPAHPEFSRIIVVSADPFPFDKRLIERP
jgi:RES domain-containing protein